MHAMVVYQYPRQPTVLLLDHHHKKKIIMTTLDHQQTNLDLDQTHWLIAIY